MKATVYALVISVLFINSGAIAGPIGISKSVIAVDYQELETSAMNTERVTDLEGTVTVKGAVVKIAPSNTAKFDTTLIKSTSLTKKGERSAYVNITPKGNQLQPPVLIAFATEEQAKGFAQVMESDLPLQMYYVRKETVLGQRVRNADWGYFEHVLVHDVKISTQADDGTWTSFAHLTRALPRLLKK